MWRILGVVKWFVEKRCQTDRVAVTMPVSVSVKRLGKKNNKKIATKTRKHKIPQRHPRMPFDYAKDIQITLDNLE